jgi:hypothetical protein
MAMVRRVLSRRWRGLVMGDLVVTEDELSSVADAL